MIKSISLWHVTPADLGVEFFDPTNSNLVANEDLYNLVNNESIVIDKQKYSNSDYLSIIKMRKFLGEVRNNIERDNISKFIAVFPNIIGCIAKYMVKNNLYCYIMVSGIVVFYEIGEPIQVSDEKYFSIDTYYERQLYEEDYCNNPEVSERKKPLYEFLQMLWSCIKRKEFHYSASEKFGNHGIRYTLCITMINDPTLISNEVSEQCKRNIRAILETSAFNNILITSQWEDIKKRIDHDDISDLKLLELSENLCFADNWSGVVLIGDLDNNNNCIRWLMEFEIFLQSQWLLFDAYSENIVRDNMSAVQIQGILNRVEFVKIKLENDISSNMEQSRHIMRRSLIESSDINIIYQRMHGLLTNKLKMIRMSNEKKRARYSLFSDLSLLIIALLQIYGVISELVSKTSFTKIDIITIIVMLFISIVCIWVMVKGRE